MRAAFRIGTGIVLILVGIAGLILPIMPGWVFIIPGLILIGDYFPPAKRLVHWGKRMWAKYDPTGYRKQHPSAPNSRPPSQDS